MPLEIVYRNIKGDKEKGEEHHSTCVENGYLPWEGNHSAMVAETVLEEDCRHKINSIVWCAKISSRLVVDETIYPIVVRLRPSLVVVFVRDIGQAHEILVRDGQSSRCRQIAGRRLIWVGRLVLHRWRAAVAKRPWLIASGLLGPSLHDVVVRIMARVVAVEGVVLCVQCSAACKVALGHPLRIDDLEVDAVVEQCLCLYLQ